MADGRSNQTPGEMLRKAREAKGADLHAAHEGTKIPPRLIEAIERDEYHKLSDQLYVKSFLRNYATWVGIDPESVVNVYQMAAGRPDAVAPASPTEMVWTEDTVSVTRVGIPWLRLILTGVGVVVVLGLLAWLVFFLMGRDGSQNAEPPVSVTPPAQEVAVVAGDVAIDNSVVPPQDTQPAVQDTVAVSTPATLAETAEQRMARLSRDTFVVTGQESPAVAQAPTPTPVPTPTMDRPAPETADLEPAMGGSPRLNFEGGQRFPVVLRVIMPRPANCTVRRDNGATGVPVIWPENPTTPPAYNLKHGLAYLVQGGYAIYWGAEDHFTLTLDQLTGAEVTLNGEPQPVHRWRAGQPVVLDQFAAQASGE